MSSCPRCDLQIRHGEGFCVRCGHPTGRVQWSFSQDRSPGGPLVQIAPGGRGYLVAANVGAAPVRVELDLSEARGIVLQGAPSRRIPPGQAQGFELQHQPEAQIEGKLLARSDTGLRQEWWERRSWNTQELRLALHLHVREERWIQGSPNLLFPPGVRRQAVRLWNDADAERSLDLVQPAGYRLSAFGQAIGRQPLPVPGHGSVELVLHQTDGNQPDSSWTPVSGGEPLSLVRMPAPPRQPGADVVVGIDFGTRNTSIRVRWRRTLVPGKPSGTVDPVGDRADRARFPTQMVLHRHEHSFRWGTEAADYVAARRLGPDEVAVDNLKTYLREGDERFTAVRPDWTNEELLGRYFERVFHRLDEYLASADPQRPLTRAGLSIRYVLCRPVLDANEGDEVGRRYEQALLRAMARCGVPETSVSLIQEPVAAAIGIARRRDAELLALPEGTAVAVVDSGGGTTHVALARVRLEGGMVSLDLAGSYALRLAEDNPAVEAIQALEKHGFEGRREVGGNVLDRVLAFQLGVQAERLLESDGRPVPSNIWRSPSARKEPPAEAGSAAAQARVREILHHSRRMKERFARASTQYLNRAPGEPRPEGEVLPFPQRDDLQGVYLVHALYDERVLAPTLVPVVGELVERVNAGQQERGVRPADVRRVFYVGGTSIDPFVRRRFGRAFPLAPPEMDAASQSDERIAERLHAVVEGAVWADEVLFSPSPLTLTLRLRGREEPIISQGMALPPLAVAPPRFFTEVLAPGDALDAVLVAEGSGLSEPLVVARAFYRNEGGDPRELTLSVSVSRERGVVGEILSPAGEALPQWRLTLTGNEREGG